MDAGGPGGHGETRIPEASLPLVRQALDSRRWLARLQAMHTISKVGHREDGAQDARLQLLAMRLTERRPNDRTRRRISIS